MYELTALEKACIGAKLICAICGKTRPLDPSRISTYITNGWPKHCGQTMRLVTKTEQEITGVTPMTQEELREIEEL